MPKTLVQLGPADHGRTMTLDHFDHAEVQDGFRYELGRGVIQVSDIPGKRHLVQFVTSGDQFHSYKFTHPGKIYAVVGGAECKVLINSLQSERHPDLSIYLSPPPEEEDPWATWVPAIVIEIVSPGSEQRDYGEKREEYLLFGVQEYWIIDSEKEQMTVLRRFSGQWKEQVVRPPQRYRTHLLPGFEFDLAAVFQALEMTP